MFEIYDKPCIKLPGGFSTEDKFEGMCGLFEGARERGGGANQEGWGIVSSETQYLSENMQ